MSDLKLLSNLKFYSMLARGQNAIFKRYYEDLTMTKITSISEFPNNSIDKRRSIIIKGDQIKMGLPD